MATRLWDESVPANTEPLKDGASRIRDLKVDVRERMVQGGVNWNDSTADDGKHCVGIDGSAYFTVYKSDKTNPALHISDTKLKPGSGMVWRTAADKPVTYQRRALIWTIPYGIDFTGRDGINFIYLPLPAANEGEYGATVDAELVEFRIGVRVASSASTTLKVDLLHCPSGTNPTDSNFVSVLSAPLELPAGTYETSTTSFTSVSLSKDDKFIIDIVQSDTTNPCEYLTAMLILRW